MLNPFEYDTKRTKTLKLENVLVKTHQTHRFKDNKVEKKTRKTIGWNSSVFEF